MQCDMLGRKEEAKLLDNGWEPVVCYVPVQSMWDDIGIGLGTEHFGQLGEIGYWV